MEIPKAKLLVYALTFIGYIWSGYGSSVLTNLKDAVLAAEGVFGDFLSKFGDVVQKIKNAHDTFDSSIDEICLFTCPNGATPVKNKFHKPVTNGCGPQGIEVTQYLPNADMTRCCSDHDVCYSTCNSDKDKCDLIFKRCLYEICDKSKAADLANKGCKVGAKMLYTATTALGCKFFQDAQQEACYCPVSKKKKFPAGEL